MTLDELCPITYTYNGKSSSIYLAKISHNIASGIRANMYGSTLQITLPSAGRVKVNVYDAIGARVVEFDRDYVAGSHAIRLNGVSNGLYMVVVLHGSQKQIIQWINR